VYHYWCQSCVLQNAESRCGGANGAKFNWQPFCPTTNARRVSMPTVSVTTASPATKMTGQREDVQSSFVRANRRSDPPSRNGKPSWPVNKDRRPLSAAVSSPRKNATSTMDKLDCSEWSPTVQTTPARRHHQQPKQHHKKKTEMQGVYCSQAPVRGTAVPPPPMPFQSPRCGLNPATVTTTGASASARPVFAAVPAAGVLLRGAMPVSTRPCAPDGHHPHVFVADQRFCRPSLSTGGRGRQAAGWYAPAVGPQPAAVCGEYLLFGPSSVLLLR